MTTSNFELNFVHICDTAFLSQSNNLNIIGIFENITATKLPAIHPRLTVVMNIGGSAGFHEFEIRIVNNRDKSIVSPFKGSFDLPSRKSKFGFIWTVGRIRFEEKGIYKVKIFGDGEKIGETKFVVEKIDQIPIP